MIKRVKTREKPWDMIIVGGGATGVGCAVDAASRGFDVLLLELNDFGKGTSSRSTKLIHGGVRYLKQGKISLVKEALKERGILLKIAPHLVEKLEFIIPCYSFWQKFYYGCGLKIYDLLSGRYSFGKSRVLSKKLTAEKLPTIKKEGLAGGVIYYDGQFDDSRLLIDLAKTACGSGAVLLNYAAVIELLKNEKGMVSGAKFLDSESGEVFEASAKVVINASGAFCDSIRKFSDRDSANLLAASQGIHLVFDSTFLQNNRAVMIPKTSDGRVLFAIPFHGKTMIGTTDTPINSTEFEPEVLDTEIDFILQTAKKYFAKPPGRADVLSVFAGIRPLVKSSGTGNTAKLSRGHTIEIDRSNLLTITGGKWTTYRRMAEDAVDQAIEIAELDEIDAVTKELAVNNDRICALGELIGENPHLAAEIHPDFDYQHAEVVYAVNSEMARTVEDVLARRTRMLFLDARAAIASAPKVAELMARELGKGEDWILEQLRSFNAVAEKYLIPRGKTDSDQFER